MNQGLFTFNDRRGRAWDLTLTLAAAQRVDASDFSEISDCILSLVRPTEAALQELLANAGLLAAVAWAIVQPQAKTANVSEDDFIEGLDGRALAAMKDAFWESMTDFFQDQGTAFTKARTLQKRAEQRAIETAKTQTAAMEQQVDAWVDQELAAAPRRFAEKLGGTSGG